MHLNFYLNILVLTLFISCTKNDDNTINNTIEKPDEIGLESLSLKYFNLGEVYADWETGEWQSGIHNTYGPTASFSVKGVSNSSVVNWNPEPDEEYDPSIHNLEVITLGNSKVLKVWSDGTARDKSLGKYWNPDVPYSNRAEISWSKFINYSVKDSAFISYKFKTSDSWLKNTSQYPTIITQFKEYGEGPFLAIKLSNEGLNTNGKLDIYALGGKLDDGSRLFTEKKIGELSSDNWNTVKIFLTTRLDDQGEINIWINGGKNGQPSLTYKGKTLLVGNNSYAKFGHYGQIYNSKVSYFDNLHITKTINTTVEEWANNDVELY